MMTELMDWHDTEIKRRVGRAVGDEECLIL